MYVKLPGTTMTTTTTTSAVVAIRVVVSADATYVTIRQNDLESVNAKSTFIRVYTHTHTHALTYKAYIYPVA